jgi:hypothetical protein
MRDGHDLSGFGAETRTVKHWLVTASASQGERTLPRRGD